MSSRSTLRILCCAALVLASCSGEPPRLRGMQFSPADRAPALRLTDANGKVFDLAAEHGHPVLLYFGYTHCPDACPTAFNTIAEALDQLGSRRENIQPLFITLDPERDTPAVLKEFTGAFQAGIVGLTGSPAQIEAVAKEYRIDYKKHPAPENNDYSIDHTSIIFLISPLGQPLSLFSHETPPDRMARRIKENIG
jgi:protein SCO1/2